MRKVLFLLLAIVLFLASNPKVRAEASDNQEVSKTFVCLLGKDYWPLLQYNGYTLKNNNVNFYQAGTYLRPIPEAERCRRLPNGLSS